MRFLSMVSIVSNQFVAFFSTNFYSRFSNDSSHFLACDGCLRRFRCFAHSFKIKGILSPLVLMNQIITGTAFSFKKLPQKSGTLGPNSQKEKEKEKKQNPGWTTVLSQALENTTRHHHRRDGESADGIMLNIAQLYGRKMVFVCMSSFPHGHLLFSLGHREETGSA